VGHAERGGELARERRLARPGPSEDQDPLAPGEGVLRIAR